MAPLKNVWQHKKLNIHVVPTKLHYATTHYFKHKYGSCMEAVDCNLKFLLHLCMFAKSIVKNCYQMVIMGDDRHTFWFSNSDVVSVH